MDKFVQLLSSEHSKTINNLAIFVYFGFKVLLSIKLELLYCLRTYCLYCTKLCFSTQADGPMLRKNPIYL